MVQRISLVIGSIAVNPPPNVENTIKVSSSRAKSVQPYNKQITVKNNSNC